MFAPVFVNAGNPQLLLLAEFLAAMVNANEEATKRVLSDFRVARRNNMWLVYGHTEGIDVMVAQVEDTVPTKGETERVEMIMSVFEKIKDMPRE